MKNFSAKFIKKISHCCLLLAFSCVTIFSANDSYAAADYGSGRTRECSATGEVVDITRNSSGAVTATSSGLNFDPTTGGKDVEFVLTNPVCVTVIATSYVAVKGAIVAMNSVCGSSSSIRLAPSPLMDSYDLARGSIKAVQQLPNGSCAAAVATAAAAFSTAFIELGVIYGVASAAYDKTEICGSPWMSPNPSTYNMGTPGYKQTVQLAMDGYLRNGDTASLALSNKTYREWYYGGMEIEDNPSDGEVCYDVTQAKTSDQYPKQKYYLKGTETGNYNCKKYDIKAGQNDPLTNTPITAARKLEFDQAYQCCTNRSQNYICINYKGINPDGNKVFCQGGNRCTIDGITFSTKSIDEGRILCAETYSLCPYNFTIGGGSELCDYYRDGIWDSTQGRWIMITPEEVDAGNCSSNSEIRNSDCTYNQKAGKCKNYCQYMVHCTRASDPGFRYISSLTSAYFSEACLNFEGDSQNRTAFNGGFILGSQRHFSAPIAQCVKETLENLFYNRAGHSTCLNFDEAPGAGGICPSGLYATDGNFVYKKGNQVKETSFFSLIQNSLQLAVKMALTLSVVFYGMNLLLLKTSIGSKKDILVYLLKIGLVLYFATGDAWQTMFFDGVYGASSEFSRMVFKIETQDSAAKRDGCQFGNVSLPDGTPISTGTSYPDGKEYLAIWDTLDCKIMRYLGFGPEVSAANIVSLIFASYFTGPIGLYFALSTMIFGIMLIAATMRALHIFLSSALAIIIFVFISPIIIPLALFSKTKSIFDNWLKELVSFCLQPMILFAYIAIFIIILDRTLIGSASFSGSPPAKTLNCSQSCQNADGSIVPYVGDQMPACDQMGQLVIDPLNDSVACLLNFNSFGSFPGFEIIGLTIPMLQNLFASHVKERILTILKGALMMYLIYKFMDEIPGITSSLIGGTKLPAGEADALAMFRKMTGTLRNLQKRAAGATRKAGNKAKDKARETAELYGNRGKNLEDSNAKSGGDQTKGGEGSGADQAKNGEGSGADKTSSSSGGTDRTDT